MNKTTLITSLLLNSCLCGNVMSADNKMEQHQYLAQLNESSLPIVERSLMKYARAGDSNAQLALAKLYESESDYKPQLVAEWYKKSAKNGNAEAQFQLGLLYIDGEVVAEDHSAGMFWVEQAAEQGHQRARIVYDSLEMEDSSFGC